MKVRKYWKKFLAGLAISIATVVLAETYTMTVGYDGHPDIHNAEERAWKVAMLHFEMGRPLRVYDIIIAKFTDGWQSLMTVTGTGNVNRVVEISPPIPQNSQWTDSGGEGSGGGCGGGSGYYAPVGNWQTYSASIGGTTVAGYEYVVSGVEWVTQNCA